jgi:hypothetical protein
MCEKCRTAGAAAKSPTQRRQESYAKSAAAKPSKTGAAPKKAAAKKSASPAARPVHKPAAGKPSAVRPSTIASSRPSAAAALRPATKAPADKPAAAEKPKGAVTKSLMVDLQIDPSKASALDDVFTLYSTDGGYKQTKTVKDDKEPGDKKVTLEFTDLVDGKLYTLEIDLGSDGMKYDLFTAMPFADIAA